jgi:iron complex outermembrane recepter protein
VNKHLLCAAALPGLLYAAPVLAQAEVTPPATDAAAAEPAAAEPSEPSIVPLERGQILVIATRIKGQVDAAQAPVLTLNEAEIASYGASSLTDLLAALAPQTGSGRGRGGGQPVILLNGQRIANFRELRNFSPEAIKKVEVLPEEVALRYGFPPDQRVINFILKDTYSSRAVELDYRQPWAGGSSQWEVEGSLLQIAGPNRFNLTVAAGDTTPLTEAERPIIQTPGSVPSVASDPDPAAFRTLIADARSFDLNTSWATGLGEAGKGGSLSFSGGINVADSTNLSGLELVQLTGPGLGGATALRALPDPLEQANRAISAVAGAGLNANFGRWLFAATLDYTHAESVTLIDRRADTAVLAAAALAGTLPITGPLPTLQDAGFDRAENNSERLESLLTLSGEPFRVPAGAAALTVKAGTTWIDFASADSRSATGPVSLSRFRVQGGINLAVPLTSRREQFGAGLGDVTLNLSANLSHVSDFGAINDWSVGLTWAPTDTLSLQASYIANQEAPSISQLGNPAVQSFNVAVYDFSRGETVLVTVIGGGNPLLRAEEQRDLKFSANWQLPFLSNSNLIGEYFRNRSKDVTAGFPLLTPSIEAAYAQRVERDASGRLLSIDRRPITLASQSSERLRWGLNLSGTVGKAAPGGGLGAGIGGGGRPGGGGGPGGPGGGGRGPGAGPRGPGGGGGPPGMMAMFGGGSQGRWSFGLYHTYRLSEDVLVAPGGPLLDLLNGDALSGGGVARHALELETGIFRKGLGLRLTGRYAAPTRVRASGLPRSSDLNFGGLFGFDLRAFVAFDQQTGLIKALPFLKGSRFALRIDNVLGTRQRVTDGTGVVPLSYQPDYLDPRGRFMAVEWRKQF